MTPYILMSRCLDFNFRSAWMMFLKFQSSREERLEMKD